MPIVYAVLTVIVWALLYGLTFSIASWAWGLTGDPSSVDLGMLKVLTFICITAALGGIWYDMLKPDSTHSDDS